MTGAVVGALRVTLGIDTAAFEEGLTIAQKRLAATGKSLQSTGAKLAGVGAVLSAGITAPFTALVSQAIPAAIESQKALGQVEAALKSMGPVAGRTSEQLQAAAENLQSLSTFDDDDILAKVTANLLTFGNVSGEVFDRAQLAAVNLSARLGQDLQSSAIQLGKALNDPVQGLSALGRVGVQFTEQQKEMIKAMVAAGDTAGAQKIILGELERQFAGAAKAQRDASPGQDTIDAWRNFQETIGALALKVLPPLTNMLTSVLNAFNTMSPSMQAVVVGAAAVVAGLGPLTLGLGAIVSGVGLVLPAFAGLVAFFSTSLIPILSAVGSSLMWLVAAGGPLLLIPVAVAAVVTVWKNWDTIGPILERLYTAVKKWIVDKLGALWDGVIAKLKIVGDSFYTLYDRVVGHSYVPDMVSEIAAELAKLDGVMVDPAIDATRKTAGAFADMASGVINNFQSMLSALKRGDIGGFASGLSSVIGTVGGLFGGGGQTAAQLGINDYGRTGLPGFATGGSFKVGGRGGIDQNLVQFRATKGEMVNITKGENDNRRALSVHVTPSPYFNVAVQEVAAPLVQQGMVGAVGMGEARQAQRARRRLG